MAKRNQVRNFEIVLSVSTKALVLSAHTVELHLFMFFFFGGGGGGVGGVEVCGGEGRVEVCGGRGGGGVWMGEWRGA